MVSELVAPVVGVIGPMAPCRAETRVAPGARRTAAPARRQRQHEHCAGQTARSKARWPPARLRLQRSIHRRLCAPLLSARNRSSFISVGRFALDLYTVLCTVVCTQVVPERKRLMEGAWPGWGNDACAPLFVQTAVRREDVGSQLHVVGGPTNGSDADLCKERCLRVLALNEPRISAAMG